MRIKDYVNCSFLAYRNSGFVSFCSLILAIRDACKPVSSILLNILILGLCYEKQSNNKY